MNRLSAKNLSKLTAHYKATGNMQADLTPEVKKRRNNEESAAQIALFYWWHQVHRVPFGLHEELLHSVPNGGFRNIVTATIMKREGQRRGVFDIKLNVARKGKHGLWIEMKAKKGNLSPDQWIFKSAAEDQGYQCSVCRSTGEAVQVITDYLS